MTTENKTENITIAENITIDLILYNKLLNRRNKANEKQNLKRVKYSDLQEEQQQKIREHSKTYYYNKMKSEEGKEELRKRAREYYQKKIKADAEKYNKIKERLKNNYEANKQNKNKTPPEFVNLGIAAH
jgi:hypothetical protein